MENKKQKTVLLALSGGVDSAVAALLLKQKGYRVIGAFMKCFSDTKNPYTDECYYLDDKRDAQKIASLLHIPFIILDFEKQYKQKVIEPMFKSYKKGFTPNPDITCNTLIKFPLLWEEAKKIKADFIATGHYSRIKKTSIGYQLIAGVDACKDQSYFLAELAQSDLKHTLFPLGNLKKGQVREIAKKNNFHNWNKHGTAGICFVGNISMQKFLQQKIKLKIGKVIMPDNKEIGIHQGINYYTIGQKAAEHIGIYITKPKTLAQKRFYIAEKRKNNVLIAAPKGHPALKKREVILKSLHIINPKEKISENLKARIRHMGILHKGRLIKKSKNYWFIFNKPVEAVAQGQFLVLYNGKKVVGCGEIK